MRTSSSLDNKNFMKQYGKFTLKELIDIYNKVISKYGRNSLEKTTFISIIPLYSNINPHNKTILFNKLYPNDGIWLHQLCCWNPIYF